jgi:hypothetical protein
MEPIYGQVTQESVRAGTEGTIVPIKISKMGLQVVMDFYSQMALEGRAFQVRAGTITTHLTGDVEITDTKAEMCADAKAGLTIIPSFADFHIEAIGGTLPIFACKSVGAVSTAGAAFVPLPLRIGGPQAKSTARVAGAGGVTVAAELATTTRRHFSSTITAVADLSQEWDPKVPPILVGPSCFYVQVGASTTGPNYYAHFDYIELPSAAVV